MTKHSRDPGIIYILDTTNRDGEQATKKSVDSDSKLFIIRQLAKLKIDRIEAGFPNSSPADFITVQKAAREVSDSMIFGLARVPLNGSGYADIERAYEAVQDAEYPGIHVFSVMFDSKSLKYLGFSKEQVLEGAVMGVDHAKHLLRGRGQVEFSFQNAASSDLDSIIEGYMRVIEAGADVINVPDTDGSRSPEEIKAVISALRKSVPSHVMISVHCHNDFGLATGNSLAGTQAGADIVEGTINGIGERAGNASLEEVVANIIERPELYGGRRVRIIPEGFNQLSRDVSGYYNTPVSPHKAIVGDNAGRHSSGIHQNKSPLYEFIDLSRYGWTGESFNLTARSGWTGVKIRLERLGYHIPDELKPIIMPVFKALADEKNQIDDYDLVHLYDSTRNIQGKYSLVDFEVSKARGKLYHGSVTLSVDGRNIESERVEGNGGKFEGIINALITAVDSVTGRNPLNIVHYNTKTLGSDSSATAEVTVVLSKSPDFKGELRPINGMYVGRARNHDTLRASVMAYLDALNKFEFSKAPFSGPYVPS